MKKYYIGLSVLALSAACSPVAPEADMETPLRVFETLASDDMQGRATGTPGGDKAREYLKTEIKALDVFDTTLGQVFSFTPRAQTNEIPKEIEGTNLIGLIDVDDNNTGPLLVITAHYDHLGTHEDGEIYNGADDNASGSAALFAIAKSFKISPPKNDVMIVWLDAEERGLQGARALVAQDDSFNGRAVFNLNLDMVSQNESEIYFAGTSYYPELRPLMEKAAKGTGLTLSFGHDRAEDGPDDWTNQSDHAIFHAAGIPFGYFGVEDHPHYHRTSDSFDTIPQGFYKQSVQTLINAAHVLDKNLQKVARPASKKEESE